MRNEAFFGMPVKEKDKWDANMGSWGVIDYGSSIGGFLCGINRTHDEAYLRPFQGGDYDSVNGLVLKLVEDQTLTIPMLPNAKIQPTTRKNLEEYCEVANLQEKLRMIELRSKIEDALKEAAKRQRGRIILP